MKRPSHNVTDKTRALHATLKRRAGKQPVMSLEEFRAFYAAAMRRPLCPYCGTALSLDNVSLDHKEPVERGGGHGPENLQLVCRSDNRRKGAMSHEEYADLLKHLGDWSRAHRRPQLMNDVLIGLGTANSFRFGRQRQERNR